MRRARAPAHWTCFQARCAMQKTRCTKPVTVCGQVEEVLWQR
jgi:hypothetical protein